MSSLEIYCDTVSSEIGVLYCRLPDQLLVLLQSRLCQPMTPNDPASVLSTVACDEDGHRMTPSVVIDIHHSVVLVSSFTCSPGTAERESIKIQAQTVCSVSAVALATNVPVRSEGVG